MSSIHDERYKQIIEVLKAIREEKNISQTALANSLGEHQSYVAKVETFERRLDLIELLDWLNALEFDFYEFIERAKIYEQKYHKSSGSVNPINLLYKGDIAVPVDAIQQDDDVVQILRWKDQRKEVVLANVELEKYQFVEQIVSAAFSALNDNPKLKNRDAIAQALKTAVEQLPDLNPSDIYQHIVYRLYIREYNRSNAEQSWKRASGDGLELFIAERYNPVFQPFGIEIKVLSSREASKAALTEMGIYGSVGDSKLDLALYGEKDGKEYIFGGIHCKASLAERVSDDVDCSQAMMKRGFESYLYTFDSKSFPPPTGDLINRGELGSDEEATDKRKYIEEFGQFSACFSYNTRGNASAEETKSGKRIYVSSFKPDEDNFPRIVIEAWKKFQATQLSKNPKAD